MKKVIITGPTGSIGRALINKLLKENIEIVAVCRENSNRSKSLPKHKLLQIVNCNLNKINQLPSILNDTYDTFYHFGWDGTFGNSRNNMNGQLKNIEYTLDAVKTASKLGCKKFIGAGSQAEYGRFEGELNDTTPTFPENGYGIAKLCAGQMSRLLCEQLGLSHHWVRILSVYGPYDGDNTMIMSTISKLLNHEIPKFTKAEQKWDYLYSADAAKAMYLIGKKGIHGRIYCLGSGKVLPLYRYIEIMKNTIDVNAKLGIGELPYAEKQVMYLCADLSTLKSDTGFEPDYSFEKGIKETIEWCKEQYK